jgi:hypothetical protein
VNFPFRFLCTVNNGPGPGGRGPAPKKVRVRQYGHKPAAVCAAAQASVWAAIGPTDLWRRVRRSCLNGASGYGKIRLTEIEMQGAAASV